MMHFLADNRFAFGLPSQFWSGKLWLAGLALVLGLALGLLPLPLAALLVGGTAVILLTFIQPLFGLFLALLAGPLGALENVLLGVGSLDTGQALLMLTLTAWLARGLANRRLAWPRARLTGPLLAFLLVMALTLLGAADRLLGLTELLKWIEVTLIMTLVLDLGRKVLPDGSKQGRAGWIVAMLLTAGLLQGVIGIWQFGLRGMGPEHFLVLDRFYRAAGTFEQPNPFGGYMNLTALLAGGLLLGLVMAWVRQGMRGSRHALLILIVTVVFGLTTLAVLFSWSRGAWLGFAAGIVVMIAFWPRRFVWTPIVLALLLAGFLLAWNGDLLPAALVERIGGFATDLTLGDVRGMDINDSNYAVLERLAHWQAALAMARDNLWLGVGFGNYGAVYADYDLINWPDALGHAHNYYLNMVAETGVIGLLAYLLLWAVIIWRTVRLLPHAGWPVRGVLLGLLGVWIAITVHHLVDKLYVNNIYIHLGVLLGLLELLGCQVDEERPSSKITVRGYA